MLSVVRRDEIRIFRGDVENHIERLRALSPQTIPVELDVLPRHVNRSVNILDYSQLREFRRAVDLLKKVAEWTCSFALWAAALTVVAWMLAPMFDSSRGMIDVAVILALLAVALKMLGWRGRQGT